MRDALRAIVIGLALLGIFVAPGSAAVIVAAGLGATVEVIVLWAAIPYMVAFVLAVAYFIGAAILDQESQ